MHDRLLLSERIFGEALIDAEVVVVQVANGETKVRLVLLLS